MKKHPVMALVVALIASMPGCAYTYDIKENDGPRICGGFRVLVTRESRDYWGRDYMPWEDRDPFARARGEVMGSMIFDILSLPVSIPKELSGKTR